MKRLLLIAFLLIGTMAWAADPLYEAEAKDNTNFVPFKAARDEIRSMLNTAVPSCNSLVSVLNGASITNTTVVELYFNGVSQPDRRLTAAKAVLNACKFIVDKFNAWKVSAP